MRFIIPILVGATIGYITNWLAIKMLFKPQEEKRFLGFHVPLTPGLIPKERERIANSIGQTVGNYLLSPEVVIKHLSSNKSEYYLRKWVETTIYRLKEDNRSLKTFIFQLGIEDYHNLLNSLKNTITMFIYNEIKKDKFKIRVLKFLRFNILNSSMESLYRFGFEKLDSFLCQLSDWKEGKRLINNVILDKLDKLGNDKRKLSEVIPEDLIFTFKEFLSNHDEDIVNVLRNILNDKQTERKIKETINNVVSHNMNKFIIMFISPEIISDKVYNMIREYLDTKEVNVHIVNILNTGIDKLLEVKVEKVFKDIKIQIGEEGISNISKRILDHISNEKNREKIIEITREIINSHKLEIENTVWDQLSSKVEEFLVSESMYHNIYTIIDDFIDGFMNKSISSTVENIDESQINKISNLFIKMLKYFIKNKLPHVVKLFNVSKIVENQINSYDVAFVEELILEIAHRELRAITWLGALLGGIMGLLSPLLQMI